MKKTVFENLNLKVNEQIKITLNDGMVINAINNSSPAYRAAILTPKRDEHFYFYNLSNNKVECLELKNVFTIE